MSEIFMTREGEREENMTWCLKNWNSIWNNGVANVNFCRVTCVSIFTISLHYSREAIEYLLEAIYRCLRVIHIFRILYTLYRQNVCYSHIIILSWWPWSGLHHSLVLFRLIKSCIFSMPLVYHHLDSRVE